MIQSKGNGDGVPRILVSIPLEDELYHDEDTWFKVYHALMRAGLGDVKSRSTITDMQNAGILFRERKRK